LILYGVGRIFKVERLERFVDRWGRMLRVRKEDIRKADAWFDKYGIWTVLFCRIVPLLRSLISIPAGMSGMNIGLFLLFTVIGTLVWNTVLVTLGAVIGEAWEEIVAFMDVYSNIAYACIAIGVIVVLVLWLRRRKNKE
jgi:membrane protein DedA with SNARE-associated domain